MHPFAVVFTHSSVMFLYAIQGTAPHSVLFSVLTGRYWEQRMYFCVTFTINFVHSSVFSATGLYSLQRGKRDKIGPRKDVIILFIQPPARNLASMKIQIKAVKGKGKA